MNVYSDQWKYFDFWKKSKNSINISKTVECAMIKLNLETTKINLIQGNPIFFHSCLFWKLKFVYLNGKYKFFHKIKKNVCFYHFFWLRQGNTASMKQSEKLIQAKAKEMWQKILLRKFNSKELFFPWPIKVQAK